MKPLQTRLTEKWTSDPRYQIMRITRNYMVAIYSATSAMGSRGGPRLFLRPYGGNVSAARGSIDDEDIQQLYERGKY